MKEDIIFTIENLVDIIYKFEQMELNSEFIKLIDMIGDFIQENFLDLDDILLRLQESYIDRDYVIFSDILQYELKPSLEG